MIKTVQLFLQWEAELYLDLLKFNISRFSFNLNAYNVAIANQAPLTIDHFRKDAGLPPHLDTVTLALGGTLPLAISSVYPNGRGLQFVYLADVSDSSDVIIPDAVLVGAWNDVWSKASAIVVGGPTREQMMQQYDKLYIKAQVAAKNLGVILL